MPVSGRGSAPPYNRRSRATLPAKIIVAADSERALLERRRTAAPNSHSQYFGPSFAAEAYPVSSDDVKNRNSSLKRENNRNSKIRLLSLVWFRQTGVVLICVIPFFTPGHLAGAERPWTPKHETERGVALLLESINIIDAAPNKDASIVPLSPAERDTFSLE
jgi:hypothetical protein